MYPFLIIQLEIPLCVDKFNQNVLQSHTETKLQDVQRRTERERECLHCRSFSSIPLDLWCQGEEQQVSLFAVGVVIATSSVNWGHPSKVMLPEAHLRGYSAGSDPGSHCGRALSPSIFIGLAFSFSHGLVNSKLKTPAAHTGVREARRSALNNSLK